MEWQTKIRAFYYQFLLLIGQCDLCCNSLGKYNKKKQPHTLICSSCLEDLPLFHQEITQGDLLNWPAIHKSLPNTHFDHLFCLAPYIPPFTQWLPQLKYQGRFELATLFSNLLVHQWLAQNLIKEIPVDLILSVPLHFSKWQVRGYNQAHLIAKPLAQRLDLPYDEAALVRTKKNNSQVGQTGSQRRSNLVKAFALIKTLPTNTKHIILVDDVLTTGSTVSEISMLLKQAGVTKVTVLTVCLTLPKH
jgi:ComF family protein